MSEILETALMRSRDEQRLNDLAATDYQMAEEDKVERLQPLPDVDELRRQGLL